MEAIRWVLEYAGVSYEDIRIEREQWPEQKSKMLTGMVPEMEFDDFVLGESNAIISFLAKEYGLAGKGNKDEARCAMIADLVSDFMQKGRPVRFEQDPEKKKVLEKAFYETDIPNFFALLVKLLEGNGGKHMVGNEMSYADILIASLIEGIKLFNLKASENMTLPPSLETHFKMVTESPKIMAWIKKRPETMF